MGEHAVCIQHAVEVLEGTINHMRFDLKCKKKLGYYITIKKVEEENVLELAGVQ